MNEKLIRSKVGLKLRTYDIFLDTVSNTYDNFLHNTLMVAVKLVVSKPHHSPVVVRRVPMYFDDPVIILFA